MSINQYTSQLVKNFITMYPEMVRDMKNSDHNEISKGIFSEWHMEGDVWTHTMMVFAQMKSYIERCEDKLHWKELLITALLHDIGKPMARRVQEDKNKVTFYGHDSISTFLAIGIIQKIDPSITDEQKLFILKLINYHQLLFRVDSKMKEQAIQKFIDNFCGPDDFALLDCVDIMRKCDYAGNLSVKDDNVDYMVVNRIIDAVHSNGPAPHTIKYGRATAYIVVGLPGCGKSTYIKETFGDDMTVVSRDNIIMEHAKLYDFNYREAWEACDQKVIDRMFEESFTAAINANKHFVIDRTNLTHKGRMKFITRLRQANLNISIVVLLPTVTTTLDRNDGRIAEGKNLDFNIIKSMMGHFNMPFSSEANDILYKFDY